MCYKTIKARALTLCTPLSGENQKKLVANIISENKLVYLQQKCKKMGFFRNIGRKIWYVPLSLNCINLHLLLLPHSKMQSKPYILKMFLIQNLLMWIRFLKFSEYVSLSTI